MPTPEVAFMLLLIVAALVLFALELFPIEVTAMGMLSVLLLTGTISLEEAVSGLSNKAVVTVAAMLVLSRALVKTGLLEVAADRLASRFARRSWAGVAVLLASAGLLSGFLNNTAVVAILIPLTTDLCRRVHLSPSKVLIPLSYASIAGGTLTLIGTSTNLLVSAIAEDHGLEPFRMFEFTPLGAILLVVGIAYVLVLAPRMLPTRAIPEALTRQYRMRSYLTELELTPGSRLAGRSAIELGIADRYDVRILEVLRGDRRLTEDIAHLELREGDVLIVSGPFDRVLEMRRTEGVALRGDARLSDEDLAREGLILAEAVVGRRSSMIGKTLAQVDFRQRVGALVLAIRREGQVLRDRLERIRLQFADDLLLVAPEDRLDQIGHSENLIVVSRRDFEVGAPRRAWVTFLVLPAVVFAAALGFTDILQAALIGTVALLLVGAVRAQEVYRTLDWSILLLIAAFVPVGTAMERTGTARYITGGILELQRIDPDVFTPAVVLGVVYLLTSLLTQTISNNATAILMAPIAIQLGADMGVDARPFLVAVTFAASAEFMTPHGYQTNLMVYGPGGYRFLDYTRFGAPLNLLFWLLASALIPLIWSF